MNIKSIGIVLAKNVFQVCVWLNDGTVTWNRKFKRNKLLNVLCQFPEDTLIAMEVCASAHYRRRALESLGFRAMLFPAQSVRPFTRRQKNGSNDTLAICEAAGVPASGAI